MASPTVTAQTGAHGLLAALYARGVRHLFGVPGHGAYPIYNALCDTPGITPIVARHEQGSLFSALTYAWTSGGIAVATSVPEAGLTNAATGLLEATLSQDQVLFVLEDNPMHEPILRSITRHYRRVDTAAGIVGSVHALFDLLEHGRPGAAALEITGQALTATNVDLPFRPDPRPAPLPKTAIAEAGRLLTGARRVAIVAGATAAAAGVQASVLALAEALQAPVLVDGAAKGVLPETHPLALGRAWSPTGPAARVLNSADIVLVIGAPVGLGQAARPWNPIMVTGTQPPATPDQRLLLVDWDDVDHDGIVARCRLYGSVPHILSALVNEIGPPPAGAGYPVAELEAARAWLWDYAVRRVPWAVPFFRQLADGLPPDAIVLLDSMVGLWLDRLLPATRARSVRFPFGTGTLGYGVPAAVGAALAQPEREVVVVAGDGAFLYNPQELATIMRYRQKVTVIIANDNCYGAIKHNMRENFGRAIAHELTNPDFIALGQAFGMRTTRLSSPDQVGAALAEALAGDRPMLIEAPLELRPPREFYT